jgi:hypothetical protein
MLVFWRKNMQFIGVDLHTNRFTCCYRNECSSAENPRDKRTRTFDLSPSGLGAFYKTLTADSYVLIEAAITTFSFTRLFEHQVKKVVIANTYELKQISLVRCNIDKLDADKLCRIIKARTMTGEQLVSPVTIPERNPGPAKSFFRLPAVPKTELPA